VGGATTCPECGARVTAFAAGCVCGADLEAHARRARLAAVAGPPAARRRRLPRPRGIALRRPGVTRLEALVLAIVLFTLVYLPALALVVALLGVLHGAYESRPGWIALCAVLAALALYRSFTGAGV